MARETERSQKKQIPTSVDCAWARVVRVSSNGSMSVSAVVARASSVGLKCDAESVRIALDCLQAPGPASASSGFFVGAYSSSPSGLPPPFGSEVLDAAGETEFFRSLAELGLWRALAGFFHVASLSRQPGCRLP